MKVSTVSAVSHRVVVAVAVAVQELPHSTAQSIQRTRRPLPLRARVDDGDGEGVDDGLCDAVTPLAAPSLSPSHTAAVACRRGESAPVRGAAAITAEQAVGVGEAEAARAVDGPADGVAAKAGEETATAVQSAGTLEGGGGGAGGAAGRVAELRCGMQPAVVRAVRALCAC